MLSCDIKHISGGDAEFQKYGRLKFELLAKGLKISEIAHKKLEGVQGRHGRLPPHPSAREEFLTVYLRGRADTPYPG